jgi:hypothetical protein
MVEFPDAEERRAMLTQLVGIENNIWMQVGDSEKIRPIPNEDLERSDGTKTSAVHFLRFELAGLNAGSGAEKRGQTFGRYRSQELSGRGLAGCRERTQFAGRRPRLVKKVLHAACAVGRGEYLTQQLIKHSACLPARIPAAFHLGNSR